MATKTKESERLDKLVGEISKVASNVLSVVTQRRVIVVSSKASIAEAQSAILQINDPKDLKLGAYVKIIGPFKGAVMVLFPPKSALAFSDIMMQRKIGSTKVFSDMDISALTEACNILSATCITEFGKEFNTALMQSTPRFTSSTTIGATNNIVSYFGSENFKTIFIEANFTIESEKLNGTFIIFCDKSILNDIEG